MKAIGLGKFTKERSQNIYLNDNVTMPESFATLVSFSTIKQS